MIAELSPLIEAIVAAIVLTAIILLALDRAERDDMEENDDE